MQKFFSFLVKGLLLYQILTFISSLGVDLFHAAKWTDEET